MGEGSGNCGYSRGEFIACEPEHAQCGQLQCTAGDFMRGDVSGSLTIFTDFARNDDGDFEECRSFTTSPDSDTVSPGLVADGTKCGNASVSVVEWNGDHGSNHPIPCLFVCLHVVVFLDLCVPEVHTNICSSPS